MVGEAIRFHGAGHFRRNGGRPARCQTRDGNAARPGAIIFRERGPARTPSLDESAWAACTTASGSRYGILPAPAGLSSWATAAGPCRPRRDREGFTRTGVVTSGAPGRGMGTGGRRIPNGRQVRNQEWTKRSGSRPGSGLVPGLLWQEGVGGSADSRLAWGPEVTGPHVRIPDWMNIRASPRASPGSMDGERRSSPRLVAGPGRRPRTPRQDRPAPRRVARG